MSIKKRALSLLLALCLVVGLFPAAALASGNPFRDVKTSDWYYNQVQYVYNNGLMAGTNATSFSPKTPTNRGMIATIMYGIMDKPEISSNSPFTDVSPSAWYAKAVNWANQEGIVSGIGNNRFGPNSPVTRESLALMLFNFAKYLDIDTPQRADLRSFRDYSQIHSWGLTALEWANATGLIGGKTGNKIDPRGNATRAEVAVILYAFCENVLPSGEDDPTIYTVTFDHNYPNGPAPFQQVEAGQTVVLPSDPTREGYTFAGWFTAAEGGTAFSPDNAVNSNMILYAHWNANDVPQPDSYTVRFDYNFEGAPAGQVINVQAGQTVQSVTPPTREGFTFAGWFTEPAGGEMFSFDTAINSDVTLYAQWNAAETFQVNFNLNYPGSLPMDPVNVPSGQMCKEPTYIPSRQDYQFDGWFTSPDEEGVKYNFATTPVTQTFTLYAHWTYTGPVWAVPYQTSDCITQYDGSDPVNKNFKMMGNTYTQGLRWAANYDGGDKEAVFNLQGKYEVMTFDVGHVDNGGRTGATLYIYFDGGTSPVTEIPLTGTMSTEHVVLNVKNKGQLRIVRKGGAGYNYATANMLLLTAAEAQGQNIVTPAIIDLSTVTMTNLASGTIMPYQNTDCIDTYDGTDTLSFFKMNGLEYCQGVRFAANYDGGNKDVLYNLGNGFDMVSFKVGHVDNGGRAQAEIRVYGDDELLDTVTLTGIMSTTTYSINTRGINKLQLVRAGGAGYNYGIADVTAYTAADLVEAGIAVPALSTYDEVHQTNLAAGPVMPYQNTDCITLYDGTSQDPNTKFTMTGVDFRQGIRFAANYDGGDKDISFNLGNGFSTMTFTAGHVDGGGTASAQLLIYKDGVLDESSTVSLTGNQPNAPISLDVAGVNNLRIVRRGGAGYNYAIANVTLQV